MKTALLTALFLIIPHLVEGLPEQVNGGRHDAREIVEQHELRQEMKSPPLIPCPAAQQTQDMKLKDLATLETHSTTCPEAGTIKEMPDQQPASDSDFEQPGDYFDVR